MRDVNYGWLLRYLHSNGASMFFLAVYIHMFRGIYYGSYKAPREMLWILGVIIYLLMMATGFMGYVLPWGQMSFWGATVITNLFSAIPGVGDAIVTWLWGGYAVDNPTLNRFFSLHYLLPFVIAGVVVLHVWALHVVGQNNPTGVEPKSDKDTVPFTPYATVKDGFVMVVFCILFAWFVFFVPNYPRPRRQLHPGEPVVTPAHIVPEWYFLPFYAILRAIPNKLLGVFALFGSIVHPVLPALARHLEGALGALPAALPAVLLGVRDRGVGLGWLGSKPPEGIYVDRSSRILTALLLRLLPDRPAAARPVREDQAAAELDLGIGAGRQGVSGRAAMNDEAHDPRPRRSPARWPRAAPAIGADRAAVAAAAAEMVVRRSVRHLRQGAAAARLQGLPGGLLELPFARICWRSATWPSRAGRASPRRRSRRSRRIQDQGRRRSGRAVRARRPAGRSFPGAVRQRARGQGAPTAAPRRPTCRCSPRRAATSAASRGSCSTSSRNTRSRAPDYIDALLNGYKDAAEGVTMPAGSYYNEYFPGHIIGMPPPLHDGQVNYDDGSPETVEQYSKDVAAFLMWAAEPHLVSASASASR